MSRSVFTAVLVSSGYYFNAAPTASIEVAATKLDVVKQMLNLLKAEDCIYYNDDEEREDECREKFSVFEKTLMECENGDEAERILNRIVEKFNDSYFQDPRGWNYSIEEKLF